MKKPTFQPTNDHKRFQETRTETHFQAKRSEKQPHFECHQDAAKPSRKPDRQFKPAQETILRTAHGNTVKVIIKSENEKVKKTGPLSPRAPEKIKKNRAEEMKIYGENACLTLFAQRPDAIVRLWATIEMAKKIGEITSYLANHKKAYHIVDKAELELVTGTEHHGGIAMLVKKNRSFDLSGYLDIPRHHDCLVLLDNVRNAQNIGGIMRTCAYYGVKGIVVENSDILHSAIAARVAEGGLEFTYAIEALDTESALMQLRQAGYQIIHITHHKQAQTLFKVRLEKKIVFVLRETIRSELYYPQDTEVLLARGNPLNSGLNVTVAAGICLAHYCSL